MKARGLGSLGQVHDSFSSIAWPPAVGGGKALSEPAVDRVLLQKLPGACLPLEASLLCRDPEYLSKDTVLSENIPLRNALDLALPYYMHRFIALQSPLGGTERAKSQPGIHAAFHKTMILFNGWGVR
jgi:hypothetical protein